MPDLGGKRPRGGEEFIGIGRLAEESGVSSRTIRYYEEIGILPAPPRSPGGVRMYPRRYRKYLAGARGLKSLGFSLDEIRLIEGVALDQPSDDQRATVVRLVQEQSEALEHRTHVLQRLGAFLSGSDTDREGVETLLALLEDVAAEDD